MAPSHIPSPSESGPKSEETSSEPRILQPLLTSANVQSDLLNIASFAPSSLQFPTAWIGHLPFAAWIIKEVSPRVFVELGTHTANSYFSFCQAVSEFYLPTKCFAVDTWQGDDHSGSYDDTVFDQVNIWNRERYAAFSCLLRMTFDDAQPHFADGSIDLLHIDGFHTYEAVRHDFETWLPKLAPGAVVLFHDTNVRERGFGVWKLWSELQERYPSNLEFLHSHGLGVLQVRDAPEHKKLHWLNTSPQQKQRLLVYFAQLGLRQLERYDFNSLKSKVVEMSATASERESHLSTLTQLVAKHEAHIAALGQAIAERDGQIATLSQTLSDRDRLIAALYASTSWRISAPLRLFKDKAQRLYTVLRHK